MRWIDIDLSTRKISHEVEDLLVEARAVADGIPRIQERDGLDARSVIDRMRAAGTKLFQAVLAHDQEAFHREAGQSGITTPNEIGDEPAELVGYHLTTQDRHVGLPWNWLHNGLEFLAAKHPICASCNPSAPDESDRGRPWVQRMIRAGFLVGENGSTDLQAILPQLNPNRSLPPELLFIPGYSEDPIRRLIYREAEAIEQALDTVLPSRPLAKVQVPADAITPSQLPQLGFAYQAIHFAGPTSCRADANDDESQLWMDQLLEESVAPDDAEYESAVGLEGEVLGVDPITSLLDDVCEKFDRAGGVEESMLIGRTRGRDAGARGAEDNGCHWLLPDGPIDPESISAGGGIPPLVFSNSYLALTELGPRFLRAGASAFVGPAVPLFSRPARVFAGHYYRALGEGWCVGAAVWRAGRACRRELGEDHPAWLSYGLQGYGSLAMQYL